MDRGPWYSIRQTRAYNLPSEEVDVSEDTIDVGGLRGLAEAAAMAYVAGLDELRSPFVADPARRAARYAAARDGVMAITAQLVPGEAVGIPGMTSTLDIQPETTETDHQAAVSAVLSFMVTAQQSLQHATRLDPAVIQREIVAWVTPYIGALHAARTRSALNAPRREVVDVERAKQLKLTARETQLLSYVASGETYKTIAEHLVIQEQSVKNGIGRIGDKLTARGRFAVVSAARAAGVLVMVSLAAGGIPGITSGS
jgi:DNA-binding CsgD family transcriptional regulator